MTKKDYILIAEQLARVRRLYATDDCHTRGDIARIAVAEVAANLARALQRDNERFNPVTFLLACGIDKKDIEVNYI
jgi:hypothetical protein